MRFNLSSLELKESIGLVNLKKQKFISLATHFVSERNCVDY